jgi:hypothetical protein
MISGSDPAATVRHPRAALLIGVVLGVFCLLLIPGLVSAQGCYTPFGAHCATWPGCLAVYTGYFGNTKGANISFTAANQPQGSVSSLTQQIEVQGISLDVMVPLKGDRGLGFAFGGGYWFSFTEPADEVVQIVGSGSLTRSWRAVPQSGNLHAAVTMDLSPSLMGVFGFRFDSFQTNFFSPSSGLSSPGPSTDTADISLNAYIPCLGLVYSSITQGGGPLFQIGVVGFPVLMGSVDYRETIFSGVFIANQQAGGFQGSNTIGKGYYLNAFADLSLATMNCIQLGAYFKYDILNANANVDLGNRNNSLPDVNYAFDFYRSVWNVGGRVSISF